MVYIALGVGLTLGLLITSLPNVFGGQRDRGYIRRGLALIVITSAFLVAVSVITSVR
jgi:hypothetical protein